MLIDRLLFFTFLLFAGVKGKAEIMNKKNLSGIKDLPNKTICLIINQKN